MAIEVIVPRQGWTMEEGIFVEWLKKEGEYVKEGEMLFVLESEKAQQEVESFDSGYLHVPANAPKSGDTVTVGQRLGYLLAEGEKPPADTSSTVPTPETSSKEAPAAKPQPASAAAPRKQFVPQPAATVPAEKKNGKTISPRAARLASELNIDWRTINGTGRSGRIREVDILNTAEQRM